MIEHLIENTATGKFSFTDLDGRDKVNSHGTLCV